jgi:hypothetical protein
MITQLLDAERLVEGNRMAYARPLRIGRDNPYVAYRRKGFSQGPQSLGIDAIVI